jgi:hypothetical protein
VIPQPGEDCQHPLHAESPIIAELPRGTRLRLEESQSRVESLGEPRNLVASCKERPNAASPGQANPFIFINIVAYQA